VNIGKGTSPTGTVNDKNQQLLKENGNNSENLADYQQYIGRRLIIFTQGDGYEVKSLLTEGARLFR